ncbi:MAG: tail fiber domain-containing protein [Bacteroidetes bacterium]|nr:tail fiber domain-containing protein [Bacteroidota bacterium]
MKKPKLILTFIIFISLTSINFLRAQLKIGTGGNISVANNPVPVSYVKFQVLATTTVQNQWSYASMSSNTNMRSTTPYNYCIGAQGYACLPSPLTYGQAWGVYGVAANATSGYNYGVFGVLGGSNNGAGIYGASRGNYSMDVAGNWAGFFNGNVNIEGGLYLYRVWYASDQRIKKNIIPVSNSTVEKITQLNAVQYQYKTKSELISDGILTPTDTLNNLGPDDINIDKIQYGYIAQEVQNFFPELVCEKENGILGVNYNGIIPLIVEAIKEQNTTIQNQKLAIKDLQEQINKCCNASINANKMINDNSNNNEISPAILYQNTPNPFSRETQIKYFIPNGSNNADIYIYNMQGTQLKKIAIYDKGEKAIALQGSQLDAGMYMYTLIIDGKEIDTKKMILTK